MLKQFNQNRLLFFLLVSSFVLFFSIAFFSEASYDAGDGIRHYLVSRYCWQHPDLLLYSWGKPFFTIVTSPFSQFGLLGMTVFNILCGIGSAYFAYKIAQQLKLNYALLVIPFLLFTPCYFPTLNSGLTEPFFGFILIASIYFMFAQRYFLACVIVSFLPFVRTEGNIILPLFFIVLLYRRKFLMVPLLAFGTLIYSLIGFFYFNDFFWIKNQNPYNGENKAFYGSGELLHFINNHNFIGGSALTLFFILGILVIIINGFKIIKNKTLKESKFPEELFLIYGAFAIYFIAHSIMWWKGLANSLGLLRVIAGVVPCSAIICIRGLNFIMTPKIKEKKILEFIFIAFVAFWVIRSPFKHDYFPYKLDQEQALIKDAGDWFEESAYTKQKVYYLYPLLAHVLNVDSFDPNKVGELWGLYPTIKEWGIGAIPDSTIVFWDAHFGPNECRIPLDTIMNDANFELIKTFKPKVGFTTLGGYPFEVFVFMKLNQPKKLDSLACDFIDLENSDTNLVGPESISTDFAYSGKHSNVLNSNKEFGVTLQKKISEIPKNCMKLNFNCKLRDPENNSKDALIVISIDDTTGKNLLWAGNSLLYKKNNTEWKDISSEFFLNPSSFPPDAAIKFYVWNKKKTTFYIDDIEIVYWGKK